MYVKSSLAQSVAKDITVHKAVVSRHPKFRAVSVTNRTISFPSPSSSEIVLTFEGGRRVLITLKDI